jgi:hypothetical protein
MDDEDEGIIMTVPVEYDDFNIPTTVEHFRIGGRHAVFRFYSQLVKPLKQGRNKLGILCVLCFKALDGTNFDQWTWVKCARVSKNNTTNFLRHFEKKHADVAIVKALLIKKKKGSVGGTPAIVSSRGSTSVTRVTSSIAVTTKKSSMELAKRGVFHWLIGSGTPFLKTSSYLCDTNLRIHWPQQTEF